MCSMNGRTGLCALDRETRTDNIVIPYALQLTSEDLYGMAFMIMRVRGLKEFPLTRHNVSLSLQKLAPFQLHKFLAQHNGQRMI